MYVMFNRRPVRQRGFNARPSEPPISALSTRRARHRRPNAVIPVEEPLMTPPQGHRQDHRAAHFDGFNQELMAERAASLGRAGRAVEEALARLKDAGASERDALLKTAAGAVWTYFVQREACGLRDQKEVIAHYAIPRAVLARLGAR
jgi:hypothetical protein